jgi:hypothetical protein
MTHLPPDVPSRWTSVPYPGTIPPRRTGAIALAVFLAVVVALAWTVIALFASSAPVASPSASTASPVILDPKIEAAKRILAGYRANPQPGDVYTISPERLVYMVAQECSQRKLSGQGLGVDRWRREGLLMSGGAPPIPCWVKPPNDFTTILGN